MAAAAWPIPAMVDRALAIYLEWRARPHGRREVPAVVCRTRRRGATRFAVYLAALDQEQAAAGVHAEVINELEPRLPDSDPDQSFEPRSQSG